MSSRTSLVFHHDFRLLWAGVTLSHFGTQITIIVLPLLATTVLDATSLQVGLVLRPSRPYRNRTC